VVFSCSPKPHWGRHWNSQHQGDQKIAFERHSIFEQQKQEAETMGKKTTENPDRPSGRNRRQSEAGVRGFASI